MMGRKVMCGASGGGGVPITSPSHPNLVFMFDMGDTVSGSTLIDLSANGYDGAINGATIVAGHIGSSLSFDGSNDTVTLPSASVPVASTVGFFSFWGYFVSVSGAAIFYGAADSTTGSPFLAVTARPGNKIAIQSGADTIETTSAVTTSVYNHIVISNDGVSKKIYINAVDQALTALAGTNGSQWFDQITANRVAEFGRIPDSSPFLGSAMRMDQFRLFDGIPATQAYVDDLYNSGVGA